MNLTIVIIVEIELNFNFVEIFLFDKISKYKQQRYRDAAFLLSIELN